jgi:replication initiation protein RepC
MTMGRYNAATAIAVIAAKANEIRSAGGYLRAMAERARQGELHLGKSVYGLAERQRQQQT